MSDFTTEEGTITTPDNHSLYTKTWSPHAKPIARLVFIHGFSDHCNFYDPLFPSLARKGIKTYSYDQRGWGRSVSSPKEKGLTGPTQQVMDDMTFFLQRQLSKEDEKDIPLFLMGHSMGGGQTLYYAASAGPTSVTSRIRGYLAEAPLIAIHPKSRPWKMTVVLGRLAGRMLPHWQMVQKLEGKYISRDEDVARKWELDELCHDTGTLEGLAGMLDRTAALETGEVLLREGRGEGAKTRLWVGVGTADMVISEEAARTWFQQKVEVADKEYRIYENWYHKLHAEPGEDKFTFADDVAKWMLDRSGPLENATTKAKL